MPDGPVIVQAERRSDVPAARPPEPAPTIPLRILPVLITGCIVAMALGLGWWGWQAYMAAPWTRDGTVRVYVVTMAPEVAGRIVQLPVVDNQFVHKDDVLMTIDPSNYAIAVDMAQAGVTQTRVNADNAQRQAQRRARLTDLESSVEERQNYAAAAAAAEAAWQQAVARLAQARVDLERTTIRSPVNGYVTNLQRQVGDYAVVGTATISVIDSDSFWVDGYFEETKLEQIREGDPATIRLMGSREVLRGRVAGVARGISVANAESGHAGLANVNPIFTWVRLAQRVPVRVHIEAVPETVRLVAGRTASVQIDR